MAQRESRLSRQIIAEVKKKHGLKVFVFKVWGSEHTMAGLPDIIGCLHGRFFGLEVKLPESRSNVSARQELVHGWIRGAGGLCTVVTSVGEALLVLDNL
jgi:hypothetical protein